MSLQLLLGGSGYGKSQYIYNHVIQASLAHPEKYYIVLVPEQYTMQVQKRIVELHPDHVTMNIDVVSFGRLAYRVFDELNKKTLTVLDDIGKSMVIRRIVAREKSKLKVFRGNAEKAGFVAEMKSTISEFMQYHITPDILNQVSGELGSRPALQGKLEDIGRIYQGFMDYITEKYMTTEQVLDQLTAVVGESQLLQKSEFYLDAFTGFTPSQYALIQALLELKLKMMISLTVDVREDVYTPGKDYDLFHLTKETIHRLNQMCHRYGIERDEDICLKSQRRYAPESPLGCVERQLYRRYGLAQSQIPGSQGTDATKACGQTDADGGRIMLFRASTPVAEMSYVAEEIQRLVRQGYRYRDIAIVAGSLPAYSHVAEHAMGKAGIPVFIDETRDVLSNGFVEFIRSLLDVIILDFSYDAVFRCLKTGWFDLDPLEMDQLENYVLATGIRGYSRWSSVWVRRYKGLTKEMLVMVNEIRERVVDYFTPLREGFRSEDGTAAHYSKVLLNYMESRGLEKKIIEKEKAFEALGQRALAKEYHQIYRVMTDLLKRMDEILVDEQMTLRTYKDILDAGMNEARIGIIPPGMDQVIVGDLRRTRLGDIAVLFFVGVNEGQVPAEVKHGGLINDKDKDMLQSLAVELAPTGKQDLYTERFYIYAMLTNPAQRLYLSYTGSDSTGKSMLPSSLIGRIEKILPKLQTLDAEAAEEFHVYSVNAAKHIIADQLQQAAMAWRNPDWCALYQWMMTRYSQELENYLQMAFGVHQDQPLSKAAVRALYGKTLEGSVTMLEKYASCAYAHFLQYGLGLNAREEYHFGAPDMGTLFHSVLELFTKRLLGSEENWHSITDAARDDLVGQCVRDVVADDRYLILMDNFRNQHMIRRLEKISKTTVWALQKQIIRGSFEPSDVEIRFNSEDGSGLKLDLSQDEVLKLSGAIDRMDTCSEDGETYVRIIDYKSGAKKFDLAALYHGLQLQLVVYMEAAMEMKASQASGHQVIPAGVLYYNIDDPILEGDSASVYHLHEDEAATDGQLNQMRLQKLKMNGLVNEDTRVLQLMAHNLEEISDILPVKFNKNGSPGKNSGLASTDQFETMFKYIEKKVKSMGQEILDGRIDVKPYQMGTGHGCTYCPYHTVCSYDPGAEGYDSHRMKKYGRDEVFELMREEV